MYPYVYQRLSFCYSIYMSAYMYVWLNQCRSVCMFSFSLSLSLSLCLSLSLSLLVFSSFFSFSYFLFFFFKSRFPSLACYHFHLFFPFLVFFHNLLPVSSHLSPSLFLAHSAFLVISVSDFPSHSPPFLDIFPSCLLPILKSDLSNSYIPYSFFIVLSLVHPSVFLFPPPLFSYYCEDYPSVSILFIPLFIFYLPFV